MTTVPVEPSRSDGLKTLVWYAAYGSNLSAERLRFYLEGGCPPGRVRGHPGCTDPSPPRADQPAVLPLGLRFAGASGWGGGVAFVDPEPSQGTRTLARLWLLTVGQVADLIASERGATVEPLDLDALARDGRVEVGFGNYGRVVRCDAVDDRPVLTITGAPEGTAAPALPYLRTIADGLAEAHGLDIAAAAAYLAAVPGAAGHWTPEALREALTEPPGPAGGAPGPPRA